MQRKLSITRYKTRWQAVLFTAFAVAALPASAQDWSGFYGGLHLGGVYADFENRVPTLPGPTEDAGSLIGGVHLGHNWQTGDVVIGAEVDFSLMDIHGSSAGGRFDEDMMASLRMRAGKVFGQTLVFGSLGVAWTEKKTALTGLGSKTNYEPGLILGSGAERWLSDSVTGRVEAFYVNVPKTRQNVGGTSTSGGSQNLMFRAGLNLHF